MILWLTALAFGQATTGGDSPQLNAQLFRPTADNLHYITTDMARRGPHNEVSLRLLGHYTREPLVYQIEGGDKVALVESVTQTDLIAGYNYDRARFGAVLPVYLRSTGEAAGGETGLGDIALDAAGGMMLKALTGGFSEANPPDLDETAMRALAKRVAKKLT